MKKSYRAQFTVNPKKHPELHQLISEEKDSANLLLEFCLTGCSVHASNVHMNHIYPNAMAAILDVPPQAKIQRLLCLVEIFLNQEVAPDQTKPQAFDPSTESMPDSPDCPTKPFEEFLEADKANLFSL